MHCVYPVALLLIRPLLSVTSSFALHDLGPSRRLMIALPCLSLLRRRFKSLFDQITRSHRIPLNLEPTV